MLPLLADRIHATRPEADLTAFRMDFIADGFLCAVQRCLAERGTIEPTDFARQLKSCMLMVG